jgi:dTDP-4-dehydrorhamnose 3,5-epimerase
MKPVTWFKSGCHTDDRGRLFHNNDFNIQKQGIKRFYTVHNLRQGQIRGWHGHEYETKYLMPISGIWRVCIFPLKEALPNLDNVSTYILDARQRHILMIPPGYYHGLQSLEADIEMLVLSDKDVIESSKDDHRLSPHYWTDQHTMTFEDWWSTSDK